MQTLTPICDAFAPDTLADLEAMAKYAEDFAAREPKPTMQYPAGYSQYRGPRPRLGRPKRPPTL